MIQVGASPPGPSGPWVLGADQVALTVQAVQAVQAAQAAQEALAGIERSTEVGQTSRPGPRDTLCRGGLSLQAGLAIADMSLEHLWAAYFEMGGSHRLPELHDYVYDGAHWRSYEHDIAVQALNERCADLHLGRPVPYADEVDA